MIVFLHNQDITVTKATENLNKAEDEKVMMEKNVKK